MKFLRKPTPYVALAIVAVIALLGAGVLNGTAAAGDDDSPYISVWLEQNVIDGYEWPMDAEVTLTIDDPGTVDDPDYTDTQTVGPRPFGPGTLVHFDLGEFQVEPGHEVVLTDGVTPKEHTVRYIKVTDIDEEADTVSGEADPFAEVEVFIYDPDPPLGTTADDAGNWTVDFSGITDIGPGTVGDAYVPDKDGDRTSVFWWVPNPHLWVTLQWNQVEGMDWPLDTEITLTIDDPATAESPDYTDQQMTEPFMWNPDSGFVRFELDDFQVQPGHLVTMTDNDIVKEHTVADLLVTAIDVNADTVSGTTDPGEQVRVDIWAEFGASRLVTADAAGNWVADFSASGELDFEQEVFDIVPGTEGSASQWDDDGDQTVAVWPPVTRIWGDVDGTGSVAIGDALKIARSLIDLPVGYEPGTPEIGDIVSVDGVDREWGDVDGSGTVAIGDALKVARHLINLPVSYEPGTPEIGSQIALFYP
jgi:hypothetical protein